MSSCTAMTRAARISCPSSWRGAMWNSVLTVVLGLEFSGKGQALCILASKATAATMTTKLPPTALFLFSLCQHLWKPTLLPNHAGPPVCPLLSFSFPPSFLSPNTYQTGISPQLQLMEKKLATYGCNCFRFLLRTCGTISSQPLWELDPIPTMSG